MLPRLSQSHLWDKLLCACRLCTAARNLIHRNVGGARAAVTAAYKKAMYLEDAKHGQNVNVPNIDSKAEYFFIQTE